MTSSSESSNNSPTNAEKRPGTQKPRLQLRRNQPNQSLRKHNAAEIQSLQDLLLFFEIPKNWDALLVTDGSATTWANSAGWSGVLWERRQMEPVALYGGFSQGTNNVAELMIVFQAALQLSERDDTLREKGYQLHVISDSQYVVNGLNNLTQHGTMWASNTGANRPIWLGILGARRKGLVIRGHYVNRDTIAPNQYCHNSANAVRKALLTLKASLANAEKLANLLPR